MSEYDGNIGIVTDGLVLHLDAANPRSFIDGSTTWNDLSGYGNNGTLMNGPVFNGNNAGSISLDGVNDCGYLNQNLDLTYTNNITYCMWIKIQSNSIGIVLEVSSDINTHSNSWVATFNDNTSGIGASGNLLFMDRLGSAGLGYNIAVTSNIYNDGKFHYFTVTSDRNLSGSNQLKLYVDGVYDTIHHPTYQTDINGNYSSQPVFLFTRNCSSYFAGASIPLIQIYNRALTQSEITQNFNALKSRYNL